MLLATKSTKVKAVIVVTTATLEKNIYIIDLKIKLLVGRSKINYAHRLLLLLHTINQ